MFLKRSTLLLLTLSALGWSMLALAGPPKVNEDGLILQDSKDLDRLYSLQDVDLSGFKSVFIAEPSVEFRHNWKRDQNRFLPRKVRDEDMQRIRDHLTSSIQEIFSEQLLAADWQSADAPGTGVLVITPNIVNLDVVAPDVQRSYRSQQFSEYAGEMTLDMTIADGESGQMLLQVRDRKRDMHNGFLEWRSRPSNQADARRMIRVWARKISDLLGPAGDRLALDQMSGP